MNRLEKYSKQIEEKTNQILALVELPEEQIRWKPSEQEWSILQVLCHVKESMQFWLNDLTKVVKENAPQFGRTLNHPDRLQAVENTDKLKIEEVKQELKKQKDFLVHSLQTDFEDADLDIERPHVNPKFGVKPMEFLIVHFLVEHLDKHIQQIKRNIQKYKSQVIRSNS